MELFEAVKQIYADYPNEVVLLDKNMMMIWNNSSDAMFKFTRLRIRDYHVHKVFDKPIITEYDCGHDRIKALRLVPLKEDGEIIGYTGELFDLHDVTVIADNSEYKNARSSVYEDIMMNFALCSTASEKTQRTPDLKHVTALTRYIRNRLRNSFARLVNTEELAYYHTVDTSRSIINASAELTTLTKKIQEHLANAGYDLEFTCDPDIYLIAKQKHFLIAVLNLIINAYKYNDKTFKKAEVSLTYDKNLDPVLVVSDNGPGLSKKVFKKATDRERLRNNDPEEMSKLGLLVVQSFCDSIGAELILSRSGEKGTTIKIKLVEAKITDYTLEREYPMTVINKYDYIHALLSEITDIDQ